MKVKKILSVSLMLVAFVSCSSKNDAKEVLINEKDVIEYKPINLLKRSLGDDGKIDSSYSVLETSYFEISLNELTGNKYSAMNIRQYEQDSLNSYKAESIEIVGDNREKLKFIDKNEFVNFMIDRGYNLRDKDSKKYKTIYSFERK